MKEKAWLRTTIFTAVTVAVALLISSFAPSPILRDAAYGISVAILLLGFFVTLVMLVLDE